jgi:hypothetical protein
MKLTDKLTLIFWALIISSLIFINLPTNVENIEVEISSKKYGAWRYPDRFTKDKNIILMGIKSAYVSQEDFNDYIYRNCTVSNK